MRHEQKPTLPPSDHDIDAYSRQLIVRWRNHGIAHQLSRVTRDSAAKLPMRLLASLRDNLHARRPAPCTVLGVAAWMCCAFGVDETGRTFSMEDPVMTRLQPRVAATAPGPARLVDLMLDMSEIFGGDLAAAPGLRSSLVHAVALLRQRGVRAAVAACIGGERIDSRELEGSV
jgi:fructuronate reductase